MRKLLLLTGALLPFGLLAQVHNVNTGQEFTTIQAAIDDALLNGGLTEDTEINIENGVYYERVVIINYGTQSNSDYLTNGYRLDVRGLGNNVFIDGGDTANNCLRISNMVNVHFDRVNLRNTEPDGYDPDFGTYGNSAHLYITGNNTSEDPLEMSNFSFTNASIRNGYVGCRIINNVKDILFENVIISSCEYGGYRLGSPDPLDKLFNVTIRKCTFSTSATSPNEEGTSHILMKEANNFIIEDCTFFNATRNAISVNSSDSTFIRRNTFFGGGSGNPSNPSSIIYFSQESPHGDGYIEIENNFTINNTGDILYIDGNGSVRITNNTFIDYGRDQNRSYLFKLYSIDSLFFYNNIVRSDNYLTIGFINLSGTPDLVPGQNLFADYNQYHHNHNPSRAVWIGEGVLNGYYTGLTKMTDEGQELNTLYFDYNVTNDNAIGFRENDPSNYLTNVENWHLKTTAIDGLESGARDFGEQSLMPELDNRHYTRDTTSDAGAFDMEGIAPIEAQADFQVLLNGEVQTSPFGVVPGTTIQLIDVSQDIDVRTFEIVEDGIVTATYNDSIVDLTFDSSDSAKVFTLRFIGSNSQTSDQDFSEKANFVSVGSIPQFITHPQDQTITEGDQVTFRSYAPPAFPDLVYSWEVFDGLVWTTLSGATDSIYYNTPTISQDQHIYRVIASNSVGADTSDPATLTVESANAPPLITAQPTNQTVTEGNSVGFSVTANGEPSPSYQWEVNSGSSWIEVSGATSATYTFTASLSQDGNQYRVRVYNTEGSLYSDAVNLSVNAALSVPQITNQPAAQTVFENNTATYSVAATGNPAPAYQWEVNTGSGWANISGATSSTYSFTAALADDGNLYRANVSNSEGSVTSDEADLTVTSEPFAPQITTQPASQSVFENTAVSFTVAATGGPAPSYQWVLNTGSGWADISGATESTYTLTATLVENGYQYRVKVYNSEGTVASNTVTLSVQEVVEGNRTGTAIIAPIVRNDPQDTYPTHYSDFGWGGLHQVPTLAHRDAIPNDLRVNGMVVVISGTHESYYLKDGTTNNNWAVYPPKDLVFIMPTSTDSAAPNNFLYYSTDQSALVYKDHSGTTHSLY
ncbi:MAG: hypothetical protein CMI35_06810 [Owenweeksia sp.]|nr:hypothetical protein [Owenweeksia sp.]